MNLSMKEKKKGKKFRVAFRAALVINHHSYNKNIVNKSKWIK